MANLKRPWPGRICQSHKQRWFRFKPSFFRSLILLFSFLHLHLLFPSFLLLKMMRLQRGNFPLSLLSIIIVFTLIPPYLFLLFLLLSFFLYFSFFLLIFFFLSSYIFLSFFTCPLLYSFLSFMTSFTIFRGGETFTCSCFPFLRFSAIIIVFQWTLSKSTPKSPATRRSCRIRFSYTHDPGNLSWNVADPRAFLSPSLYHLLSIRERSIVASVPWRACLASLSYR